MSLDDSAWTVFGLYLIALTTILMCIQWCAYEPSAGDSEKEE